MAKRSLTPVKRSEGLLPGKQCLTVATSILNRRRGRREWTASDFTPYPGFVAGPYKEYSAPSFGNHKVLRGGCWATRSRLISNSYRNFYMPERRDVWAGFRTCA